MNEAITQYIATAPASQKHMMETLRALIHEEIPNVVESFKWGRPVFSTNTDFAYFKTAKAYLTLGFFKTGKLTTHTELLEGTGKDMRHIKLRRAADLNTEIIRAWLRECAAS